jgi:hypothetical protein
LSDSDEWDHAGRIRADQALNGETAIATRPGWPQQVLGKRRNLWQSE